MTWAVGREHGQFNRSSSHPRAYASSDQVKTMEDLMTRHDLYLGHWDRAWKILEAHRIDERTPGDGTRLTEAQANRMLRWMVRQIDRKSDYYWAGKMKVAR